MEDMVVKITSLNLHFLLSTTMNVEVISSFFSVPLLQKGEIYHNYRSSLYIPTSSFYYKILLYIYIYIYIYIYMILLSSLPMSPSGHLQDIYEHQKFALLNYSDFPVLAISISKKADVDVLWILR